MLLAKSNVNTIENTGDALMILIPTIGLGSTYFFEEDKVFITATLQGTIDNPQILIDGKIFSDHNEQPIQDLKHILQEGINSFIEKLLSAND